MTTIHARPKIVILGDLEQGLRRLGNWQAIDAAADVTAHLEPPQPADNC